jgi:ferritin-like protein
VETVDNGNWVEWANYGTIIACEHILLTADPLLSQTLNVAVSAERCFILVIEEKKIKLICWACIHRSSDFATRLSKSC